LGAGRERIRVTKSRTRAVAGTRIAVVLVSACLLAAACAAEEDTPGGGRSTLRVGAHPFIGYAPLYYADAVDLCEEDGLDLELVEAADPSLLDAQLRSGRLEVAAFTNTTLVRNVAAGLELQAILPLDFSVGADGIVAAGRDVSVEDLVEEQMELAIDVGDTAYFLLMVDARRSGYTPDDFNVVQMTTDAAATTFVSGRVAAAGLFEPFLSKALERPDTSLVVSSKELPGVISDVFVSSPSVVEDRADDLRRFADCWYRAVEEMSAESDAVMEVVADAMRIRPASLASQMKSVDWPDRDDAAEYLAGARFQDLLGFSVDLYRDLELLRGDVDVENLVETAIVDAEEID
jgi:NitT/TauT family transport system substrate-binding protein